MMRRSGCREVRCGLRWGGGRVVGRRRELMRDEKQKGNRWDWEVDYVALVESCFQIN